MGLIRSELYYFGIRIQKIVFIAFIGRGQTIYGLMTQTLKNLRSKIFTEYHLYRSDICL